MYCVFLIPFSAFRLLQWTVAPTTPGRSEVCRTLRATRSGHVHSVNRDVPDPGAALTAARYDLRPERRVTRLPAGFCVGGSAARGRRFHHGSHAHFRILTVAIGHRTRPGARSGRAIQLYRCAATSCRRRAILSPIGRSGYPLVSEGPCAAVPCSAEVVMHRRRRHIVSPMCHPMCHSVPVSTGNESEDAGRSVNACERARFPGAPSETR